MYNPSTKFMELEIYQHFTDLDADKWDKLLTKSETDVPFLRFGYLKNWWEFKGGGEWPDDSQLFLITAKENERLVGIAPLFSPDNTSAKRLLLLGSVEISDYLDVICLPEYKESFLNNLLHFIHSEMGGALQINLMNIPEKSSTLELLNINAHLYKWAVKIEQTYRTPAIKLEDNWEAYLASIDKKQRHEIRRKMRRAEEYDVEIQWYIVNHSHALATEIEAFFSLMAMDAKKERFLTSQMRQQMSAIIHWAFDEGILQLSFLEIDGKKVASYLCFDYGKKILVYNSGFDFNYSEYSPGWVLLSYLIQNAINSGKTHFDFMRGDETYKYRFGAKDSFVMQATLTRV